MIEDINFAFLEVERIEGTFSVMFDKLFIDGDGMVGEEGVSDIFWDELFLDAELDKSWEEVAIEIDFWWSLCNIILFLYLYLGEILAMTWTFFW